MEKKDEHKLKNEHYPIPITEIHGIKCRLHGLVQYITSNEIKIYIICLHSNTRNPKIMHIMVPLKYDVTITKINIYTKLYELVQNIQYDPFQGLYYSNIYCSTCDKMVEFLRNIENKKDKKDDKNIKWKIGNCVQCNVLTCSLLIKCNHYICLKCQSMLIKHECPLCFEEIINRTKETMGINGHCCKEIIVKEEDNVNIFVKKRRLSN